MFSLLNLSDVNKKNAPSPRFFTDLNLDQIMAKVTEDWNDDVRKLYESFPTDQASEEYRRTIYSDVKQEDVFAAMMDFERSIRERAIYAARREKAEDEAQKQTWYLREAQLYVSSLEALHAALEKAMLQSEGLKGLKDLLAKFLSEKAFQEFSAEVSALWQELSGFRVTLTYEKERFTLAEGKEKEDYEAFLEESFPKHGKIFKSPFQADEDFSRLEEEIVRLFRKKHKGFFEKLGEFYKKQFKYVHYEMTRIGTEMGYYLAFAQFQRKMQGRGFVFCMPKPSNILSVKGLYDLALAFVNSEAGKTVVANEAYLSQDESFFVLTGPNQGGKTTYARSLGQLIYFTKMGLDVPAEYAEVPYYGNLWTHFSVEESTETGRGKLMDELVRLKPMMEKGQENAFVVINELFTTAANFDANVMGKRVLEYFIGEHCKGIYVTHLGELSKACEGVVSLRACVDENQKLTYRIKRSEAEELAGANRQVEKYRLTYEQLKERFS